VLKLEQGGEVAAGQLVGVCIHTADGNGFEIRMARRQAGIDSDTTDDDFGGTKKTRWGAAGQLLDRSGHGRGPLRGAPLRIHVVQRVVRPASRVCPPVIPAAFVGAISYPRML
jgi:hypothetical protein